MKTNLAWLNEYLSQPINLDEEAVLQLAERLERTSVEVDTVGTLAGQQNGLVVAKVLSVRPHPDSDHMVITQIDTGEGDPIQIVTGAPNVAEGQLVVLATVGAHIIDHQTGQLVEIKKACLRGEDSYGMLVALQEIGFDNKIAPHNFEVGIHVFNPKDDVKPGDDALTVLGMRDPVIDTDLTPNRSDMLSMVGAAYEFGAILAEEVSLPQYQLEQGSQTAAAQLQVHVNQDLAPQYALRVVNDVTITDSPLWLQKRLWNAGIRPINNVVDCLNYLMILYGQPLHAYDLDKLQSKELNVRLANQDETVILLDGEDYELRAGQDIVIADGSTPITLAGIMGGQAAEVDHQTHNIVIESARFNASLVRSAARRHNLHTESSGRFERGIDAEHTLAVLDHAASLVAELATATVAQGQVIGTDQQPKKKNVVITLSRINQILGTSLDETEVANIFKRLAFEYQLDQGQFTVTIPGRRPDISIPVDLIEEVARLHGYDNLPIASITGPTTPGKLTKRQRFIRASRRLMESLGMDQAISYALTTPEKAKLFADNQAAALLTLDYPMSSDRTSGRQNLLAGLLDDVAYNVARSVQDIALYEQGRIFLANQHNQQPQEIEHLAGVLTGNLMRSGWQTSKNVQPVDFYDIKGIVTAYFDEIGIDQPTFVATDRHAAMHPGQTADIYLGKEYLGFVGQIHPQIVQDAKLPVVFGFELNLETILTNLTHGIDYQPVSRYPQITRDLALLVDQNISNQSISTAIQETANHHLVALRLFDLYQGKSLPKNKKSLAYQLTYQDSETTLGEEEINQDLEKVTAYLQEQFNAEIR